MVQKRFYNATDKLISAFLTGKIIHSDCKQCAVGNLMHNSTGWVALVPVIKHLYSENEHQLAMMNISDFTNYTVAEIFEVEKCFEGRECSVLECNNESTLNAENDVDGFYGLCSVFDYLAELEDWSEEQKGSDIFELLCTCETFVNN